MKFYVENYKEGKFMLRWTGEMTNACFSKLHVLTCHRGVEAVCYDEESNRFSIVFDVRDAEEILKIANEYFNYVTYSKNGNDVQFNLYDYATAINHNLSDCNLVVKIGGKLRIIVSEAGEYELFNNTVLVSDTIGYNPACEGIESVIQKNTIVEIRDVDIKIFHMFPVKYTVVR